jgi:hypothetical protein
LNTRRILEGFTRKSLFKPNGLNFKDRSGNAKAVATKIAADDWEELVVCFKKIELDNLSKLKAPESVL